MEEEFESQAKEYKKNKAHIENLELQHVLEAKTIIDKLLLEAYLKAEDKEKFLDGIQEYYRNIWLDYTYPNRTVILYYKDEAPFSINLFEYFFQNDPLFRKFYGFDNEVSWSQVDPRDKRLKWFKKDLCKLFFSSFLDIKYEYEKNIMFSLVDKDFIWLINDFDVQSMKQTSHTSKSWFHYDSSHDYRRDKLGVKKYIESLNSELVLVDNQTQGETVESTSPENRELEQKIIKIKKTHFTEEHKKRLIEELEQEDYQIDDGRTNGKSI